nr:tetratricopeptide repeat protein [uncultured Psychroserpens sp.]
MKNYIIYILTCAFSITTIAQDINTEIAIEGETPFLLGKIDKDGLTSANYNSWFSKNYNDYNADKSTLKSIATQLNAYQITLFMGTWCGDSKKEVPRFYKILEACNFPENQLTVVAVSRKADMYKQSPKHEEAGLNIHRVPTFIFYKDGKEVNRIVEHPVESLEKDILNIITTNDYTSNYQIVAKVNGIIENNGLKGLKKASKTIIKSYKNELKSMYELNTYAHILFTTNRSNEALEVLKLNTKLFPKESKTYQNLGNKYYVLGNTRKARKQYKKALKLNPDNKDLAKRLKTLK